MRNNVIACIDTGIGNLASLLRAFSLIGAELSVTRTPEILESAAAIVLPGVGAFGDGMAALRAGGFVEPLRRAALDGTPVFGICLGMQLLSSTSEEHGHYEGLGLVDGNVVRLPTGVAGFRVPNVGWCDVEPTRPSGLFPNGRGAAFYHVHSYHVEVAEPASISATIEFAGRKIAVAFEHGNVWGVQFHPEKSQDDGLDLLRAFLQHLEILGRWSPV